IADEIEIELVVKRCVDRARRAEEAQRIAIGSRAHDRLGADIATCTRAIFNDELLTQPLRQPLPDEPRSNVGRAGWSERHDQVHRQRRIGLRPRDVGYGSWLSEGAAPKQRREVWSIGYQAPSIDVLSIAVHGRRAPTAKMPSRYRLVLMSGSPPRRTMQRRL